MFTVRYTGASLICELVTVAYDADIRPNNGFVIEQLDRKWGRIDFTGSTCNALDNAIEAAKTAREKYIMDSV